jgi:hypothetical protein
MARFVSLVNRLKSKMCGAHAWILSNIGTQPPSNMRNQLSKR